ncbi:tripartite tricarboxylate transporter substrate binding protein [Ramlibacter alkalitolerans]|uniref:Tripartite tricarboxylate transporter substrate binding protein n=2 Tax=Ramlibacter alkalitolerans TaxID=2039631 RepID=A0ABS1JJF6_9BURK|nr:tripartite tricarboxylate transporter substrate binding protein [Ramlibacter alkalitolerans]
MLHLLRAAALALLAACLAPVAAAQAAYPQKRVTLVTHSSPGGGSDVFVRELARHLGPVLGVNFAVENVTGGSGAKAMAMVARGKPDGSVFYVTTPTYIQTTLLSKPDVGYTALEPVAIVFEDPEVVFTRAQAPFQSLAEVIEHARRNPGKARWGAANPTSLERIALERMARKMNVKVPVVPHEGGGDLMINVLNGTLDIGVGEVEELKGQLQAGKLRILGVLSDKRMPLLPQVPTAREQGVDVVVRKFRGLAAPKGVAPQAVQALEAGLRKVLATPDYRKSYTESNLVPLLLGHEEALRFTNEAAAEIGQTFRELGITK